MPRKNKKSIGSMGEAMAMAFLQTNCFEIISKNYRAGRIGEIDLIAREKEFLCFIEVKTRNSEEFGSPAQAVNYRKQMKIKQLAYIYINNNKLYDCNIRFDIVEVILDKKSREYKVNIIRNAF